MRPALLLPAVGALALVGCGSAKQEPGATGAAAATKTTAARRATLTTRETVAGTLGYAGARPVLDRLAAGAAGTITAVAREGARRSRGQVLYRLDGQAVRLLYGAVPAFRALRWGDHGSDVAQLERNLVALGYDPGDVDSTYDGDTAAAVTAWQEDVGWTRTGSVALGQVVFLPGARRIGDVVATRGALVAAGTQVMTTTSPRRVVSVDLDAKYQALVHRGDDVVVTLPDDHEVHGRVTSVGSVAQAAPADSSDPTGGSSDDAATVPLRVRLDAGAQADASVARLDGAPVSVGLASEVSANALVVPVTALLARAGGGFAVDVVAGGGTRRVAVEVGQVTDGLAAITGGALRVGDEVVVPDDVR